MDLLFSMDSLVLLADVGIPMIFISLPAMLLALLPVIAVEAFVLRKRLSLSTADAFRVSSNAHLVSTVIGIPLGWGAALGCEIVLGSAVFALSSIPSLQKIHWNSRVEGIFALIVTAPWISGEGGSWTVPFAQAVLLIPFFFVSVLIERYVAKRSLGGHDIQELKIKCAVRDANLVSYAGLLVFTIGVMVWPLIMPTR